MNIAPNWFYIGMTIVVFGVLWLIVIRGGRAL